MGSGSKDEAVESREASDVQGSEEEEEFQCGVCGLEDDEEGEDALPAKGKKILGAPPEEELRIHRISHLPFRKWCPECMAGRGTDDAHGERGK